MEDSDCLREHCLLTRRYYLAQGCAAAAAWSASPLAATSTGGRWGLTVKTDPESSPRPRGVEKGAHLVLGDDG